MSSYPEDAIQYLADSDWWEKDDSKELCRGKLVWAHVQFYSEIPIQLIPERVDSKEHDTAYLKAVPLRASQRKEPWPSLPVAALPNLDGADCYHVNRAKKRPCLVVAGADPTAVDHKLSSGKPKWTVASYCIVAPFYSVADKYKPALAEKIRHAVYRQFFWDNLPVRHEGESILRFDQMFPIGCHHDAFESSGFKLSDYAMLLVDEWLKWYVSGDMTYSKNLISFQDLIASLEAE